MEEEKAAAYYDELSRKGEGAARFKQGLGFNPNNSTSNDVVPSRGSSFLSSFVRASKNPELDKQSQLQSIQNKLSKKKPRDEEKTSSSSRVSRRSRSRSRERHYRDRDRDRDSRRRYRSRSRSRESRSRDEERQRRNNQSVSPRDRRSEKRCKDSKSRNSNVDYAAVIEGYDKMTPAERVKAKMKLQLSETVERDETKGMGAGWERFDFDKDAPLDDEEIEAADDDAALVKRIGQTFRFSSMEARREEQIKAAHDEAIFGPSHPPRDKKIFSTSSHPLSTGTDDETEAKSVQTSTTESAPVTNLISDQVRKMQQGSWRDRARRA